MRLFQYRNREDRKYCIKRNLLPVPTPRYEYLGYIREHSMSVGIYLDRKRIYRDLGNCIGFAIKCNDYRLALSKLNHHLNEMGNITTDWYSFFDDCFNKEVSSCNDCNFFDLKTNMYNAYDDYNICESCKNNYYWNDRNGYYQEEAPDYDDDEDDDNDSIIGDYHSSRRNLKKIPSAFDKRSSNVFLGMELEIETDRDNRYDKAQDLLDHIGSITVQGKDYNYCLLENDGSLSYGFEMVTAWTGLDVHEKQLKYFNQQFRGMRSHNTSTCGLHVHIDKSDMTTLHASKIVLFINDPNNLSLVKCIARRDSASYAKIKDKKTDNHWLKQTRDHDNKRDQIKYLNYDRYEAVNFQNDKTVEFRLFKGSLVYSTIMACLEFTYSTYFFCKESSINDLTTHKFLEFICKDQNKPDTKFLRAYLKNKGYILPIKQSNPSPNKTNVSELITFE